MLAVVAEHKARRLRSWQEITFITATAAGVVTFVCLFIRFWGGVRELLPVALFEAFVAIVAAVAWIRVRRALAALEKFL